MASGRDIHVVDPDEAETRKITNSKLFVAKGKYSKVCIDWVVNKFTSNAIVYEGRNGFHVSQSVRAVHMQVISYSSPNPIFKFSAILTKCLEQTVMIIVMTKMLYLHFLHFLCDILNSTKSQMV